MFPSYPLLGFILFLLFFTQNIFAQNLEQGDFAILGVSASTYNCGGPAGGDEISFVCFKDITTGTQIDVTDNGWERCLPNFWGDSEGVIRFTRTGATILAGTVITYRLISVGSFGNYLFVSPDSDWSFQTLSPGLPPPTAVNMNAGGDQIFFMTAGNWQNPDGINDNHNATYSGKILFGFNTLTSWQANCANDPSKNSNLPPEISPCFFMAPTAASDFTKYTGPISAASRLEWIDRIRQPANWSVFANCVAYETTAPIFPAGLQLEILPTQFGINTSVLGICKGDSINLSLELPLVGAPFRAIWASGISEDTASGLFSGDQFFVGPQVSTNFEIIGLTDANGCTIRGNIHQPVNLEVWPPDSTFLGAFTDCRMDSAGFHFQKLSNFRGCDSTVFWENVFDSNLCNFSFESQKKDLICADLQQGEIKINAINASFPVICTWESAGHNLFGRDTFWQISDEIFLQNLPKGEYCFLLENAFRGDTNFCITLQSPEAISVFYSTKNETCIGKKDAEIRVDSVLGGMAPFLFSFENNAFSNTKIWENLAPGQKTVQIQDAFGCEKTDTLQLLEIANFSNFKILSDTLIYAGDSLEINFQADFLIDSLVISPNAFSKILSHEKVLFFPSVEMLFQAKAFDENGCLFEDNVFIGVIKTPEIFVPNVFAPDAQNIDNQAFKMFFGRGVSAVLSYEIYNRFGELVFKTEGNETWNGSFGKRLAPTGLYVWSAKILLKNGREKMFCGNVVLVR